MDGNVPIIQPKKHVILGSSAKLETMYVSCPYCKVGKVNFPVTKTDEGGGKGMNVDIKTPYRCASCSQYVYLRPVVQIMGVTAEQVQKEKQP
jgi:DNA-directed RNA polymerase subunit RPC12/RpoP